MKTIKELDAFALLNEYKQPLTLQDVQALNSLYQNREKRRFIASKMAVLHFQINYSRGVINAAEESDFTTVCLERITEIQQSTLTCYQHLAIVEIDEYASIIEEYQTIVNKHRSVAFVSYKQYFKARGTPVELRIEGIKVFLNEVCEGYLGAVF